MGRRSLQSGGRASFGKTNIRGTGEKMMVQGELLGSRGTRGILRVTNTSFLEVVTNKSQENRNHIAPSGSQGVRIAVALSRSGTNKEIVLNKTGNREGREVDTLMRDNDHRKGGKSHGLPTCF